MNKCRILCFSYRCINIINSIVSIFNSNMCGSKTINAFNSCLFIKECDISNSNEPIVLDTTNIVLYDTNIRNCNRNAIYAYRGNIEIVSNIINNTRRHGIKLI